METLLKKFGTLCLIATLLVACKDANSQPQKEAVVKNETIADNQHQCIADEPQGPIEPEEECFDKDYFEEMPEFPGGIDKMLQFIAENTHLPKCVTDGKVQGRSIIEMVVEKDGTLSDFKVVRSLHKDCDAEAIRVLKLMPRWKTTKRMKKPMKYTVPVQFRKPVCQK